MPIPAKSWLSPKPMTWDPVHAREEVDRPFATIYNPLGWITKLFGRLQRAEEDVRLLAEAREEEDAMEIDISNMRSYYETVSNNASELFWEISQN
jgi:hypothetical protein